MPHILPAQDKVIIQHRDLITVLELIRFKKNTSGQANLKAII